MNKETVSRKFLIATHGAFAKGVQSALELIIGPAEHVYTIQAYTDGNKSIEDELKQVLDRVGPEDELIIFSDLLGGSVNNQILRFALRENVHVVSGFNLPLIIEIVLSDPGMPAQEVIENAISRAKDQMVYVNRLISSKNKETEND